MTDRTEALARGIRESAGRHNDQNAPVWVVVDRMRVRIDELEAALTPSADTKAAYMGEFQFGLPECDEDGNEVMRSVNVPWVTIKEIMAAIRAHADGSESEAGR